MFKATLRVWIVQVAVLLVFVSAGYAQKITPFDPPGSGFTIPQAINSEGEIAGRYKDISGFHGFLRSKTGSFTPIDAPGAITTAALPFESRFQLR